MKSGESFYVLRVKLFQQLDLAPFGDLGYRMEVSQFHQLWNVEISLDVPSFSNMGLYREIWVLSWKVWF